MSESFDIDSGKFKAGDNGEAQFEFDIPTELFADGFESGDVSAWLYTRTDFTQRRKQGTIVGSSCLVGGRWKVEPAAAPGKLGCNGPPPACLRVIVGSALENPTRTLMHIEIRTCPT